MKKLFLPSIIYVGCLFPLTGLSQGLAPDPAGHAQLNGGGTVLACWNFNAGGGINLNPSSYKEILPNLKGWDFRINLPFTNFHTVNPNDGSGIAMTGTIDDNRDQRILDIDNLPMGDFPGYGHVNNSIWLFKTQKNTHKVHFKIIPSKRGLPGSGNIYTSENVSSLTGGWKTVAPSDNVSFREHKPTVLTMGTRLGYTTIFVFARDLQNNLYFSRKTPTANSGQSWDEPWEPVNEVAEFNPAICALGTQKLVMVWKRPGPDNLVMKIYDLRTSAWSESKTLPLLAIGVPVLISDESFLNIFWVQRATSTLLHTSAPIDDPDRLSSSTPVFERSIWATSFDVMMFNNRFHAAFAVRSPDGNFNEVMYNTSLTPPGRISRWGIPSKTNLLTTTRPCIAAFYENIFVIATNRNRRVAYARKDPNARGNDLTSLPNSDKWLEAGTLLDNASGGILNQLEVLKFNSDIYLVADNMTASDFIGKGSCIINFSRAALKNIAINKWRVKLEYGGRRANSSRVVDEDDAEKEFAKGNDIPLTGDFDGDNRTDIINFKQKQTGNDAAPVYVAHASANGFNKYKRWHRFFSLRGEIPGVGDFNGDGKDDVITFTQKRQNFSNGTEIGPAVVWVALSDGEKFQESGIWHRFFSLKGEIPAVGDFNGDGKDDIVTFTQSQQKNADGSVIGPAVVWVALSDGQKFGQSRVWHTFFSLKGEIPMVGDFNGDGKDDIVTFTQKAQKNANGTLIGNAVVWVALSTGQRFGQSGVWHTFFSLKGEIPLVGDMNFDGRDDIMTCLRSRGQAERKHDIYVAYSESSRFGRSSTWLSTYITDDQKPAIGAFHGASLHSYTRSEADRNKFIQDVYAFDKDGTVKVAVTMANTPYAAGAPWENYKWFPEKIIGMMQYPEWIFNHPGRCTSSNYGLLLIGASGVGGPEYTASSVRSGGRAGHIIQEFGHTLFANCFRKNKDAFGLFDPIFTHTIGQGGISANLMPGCPDEQPFYSCRDRETDAGAEHYFLDLLLKYRLKGEEFRNEIINASNGSRKTRLRTQYLWFKRKWFNEIEFKSSRKIENASLPVPGLQCMIGERLEDLE